MENYCLKLYLEKFCWGEAFSKCFARTLYIIIFCLMYSCAPREKAPEVDVFVDPSKIVGTINENIYGHFYEHIYHSANGGLWGDMIWNRSFEEYPNKGKWTVSEGVLTQSNLVTDVKLFFGKKDWKDYEFTLEAKHTGGYEAFLILFRVVTDQDFYWHNIGGWGNSQSALEKETHNDRVVVTDFVKGKIDADVWHKIKIRCMANRIQAWLNDNQILDFTDKDNPHLSGRVGLGSWSTEVNYRNIKVTSPEGDILYEGLPELPDEEYLPRHWGKIGNVDVIADNSDPLNSELSLKISNVSGESGIYQENIPLITNTHYHGSLWAKGQSGDTLIVRLNNEEKKLAENIHVLVNPDWKQYPIHFLPLETTDNASIEIIARTKEEIYIDQISLMSEKALENDGFRTDLFEAVKDLHPPMIRWPGGCFAELYRWKDGIGPQHKREVFPVNMWDDKDVNSLGTDEFITLCKKLGSEPLIVINSGFHEGARNPQDWIPWVKEACDWLEYCNGSTDSFWGSKRAENGHTEPYNVKYWEIDNELWRSKVPDPLKYSLAVRMFSEALRKIDPSIIIIAHGGNGTDEKWNNVLLEKSAKYFDILSVHHYMNPDRFMEGVNEQERFYANTAKTISNSRNPDIKLYVSEWNAQTTDWRTGLYAGGLLNAFERCGDFLTMGGPALFLRHVTATAWDNAFINFDHTAWFPAPNYVVMKLWRENYAPNRIHIVHHDSTLNIVATLSGDKKTAYCKIVNPAGDNKRIIIEVNDLFPIENVDFQIIAPDSIADRNTMAKPDLIIPVSGKVKVRKQNVMVEMPAYSCGVIVVNSE